MLAQYDPPLSWFVFLFPSRLPLGRICHQWLTESNLNQLQFHKLGWKKSLQTDNKRLYIALKNETKGKYAKLNVSIAHLLTVTEDVESGILNAITLLDSELLEAAISSSQGTSGVTLTTSWSSSSESYSKHQLKS